MPHDISVLQTERLLLRKIRRSDIDFVTALFALPELVRHRPDPRPDTPDTSRLRVERDLSHWEEHGFGRYAIEVERRPIGLAGLTMSERFGGLNLSYHLHPTTWGKGYAAEAVAGLVRFGFGPLEASRLVGLARPANPASCRVLERAGFMFESEVDVHDAPTRLYVLARRDQATRT